MTALENAMLPGADPAAPAAARRASARPPPCARSGLGDRHEPPAGRAVGRRAAARGHRARAGGRPRLILADEPTGNLDPKTSEVIWDLFLRLQAERGLAFVIATHNHELARRADRGLPAGRGPRA